MAFGNIVIVNNTRENVETIGDAGLSYDGEKGGAALAEVLQSVMDKPALAEEYRCRAREHVAQHFTWDAVTDQYEELFRRMLKSKGRVV
jgi:glycosyltransferase involved in cell wall biosynthesis